MKMTTEVKYILSYYKICSNKSKHQRQR